MAVLGLGPSGCATPPPPAEVDYSYVRRKVKTVALAPLRSGIEGVKPEQVEAAFEQRAIDRLVGSGLIVVEPAVWKASWRRYAEDVGGIFDVSTGKPDEERLATVQEAVIRELVETRGIEGILWLAVQPIDVHGVSEMPKVCGRVLSPFWPDGWADRGPGQDPATLVRFSCLVGVLEYPGGKKLFTRQAGIEGVATYDAQTRAVRPVELVLRDGLVLDQATATVLLPFDPPLEPPAE